MPKKSQKKMERTVNSGMFALTFEHMFIIFQVENERMCYVPTEEGPNRQPAPAVF
jgi:hypothetical protein